MKAALILTGLMRVWEDAYPKIKEYILDRYETDVYLDIWSEVGLYTGVKDYLPEENGFVKLRPEDRGFHASGELVDLNHVHRTYNPVSMRVENFETFKETSDWFADNFVKAYTRPRNTASMFYKIYQGFQLISQRHYDLVIRMRPDLIFNSDIGILSPENFYTIRHRNKYDQGTGDGFQASNMEQMEVFCNAFYSLPSYYNAIGVSCPHLFTLKRIFDIPSVHWIETQVAFECKHARGPSYSEPE
jgi:hypothetical protein